MSCTTIEIRPRSQHRRAQKLSTQSTKSIWSRLRSTQMTRGFWRCSSAPAKPIILGSTRRMISRILLPFRSQLARQDSKTGIWSFSTTRKWFCSRSPNVVRFKTIQYTTTGTITKNVTSQSTCVINLIMELLSNWMSIGAAMWNRCWNWRSWHRSKSAKR